MTRQNKILLGVLAFFPIGYMLFFVAFIVIFMVGMFATVTAATSSSAGPPTAFPFMGPFFALFGLHFLAMVVMLAQLVVFILLLVRNPLLRGNEQILWLLAILLAAPIGAPLYWYLHIWKAPDATAPPFPR